MIANYGYKDGSGDWFISIDTDKCAKCEDKPCVEACPRDMFYVFTDDWDDEVVGVVEEKRKKVKFECMPCTKLEVRPCVKACKPGAITFSF